jgi:hypothetical protein
MFSLILAALALALKEIKVGANAALFTIAAFLILDRGHYDVFKSHYAQTFLLLTLIFITLYINCFINAKGEGRARRFKIAVMFAIAIVGGTFGQRMIGILFAPLCFVELIALLRSAKGGNESVVALLSRNRRFLFAICFSLASFVGYLLFKSLDAQAITKQLFDFKIDGMFNAIAVAFGNILEELTLSSGYHQYIIRFDSSSLPTRILFLASITICFVWMYKNRQGFGEGARFLIRLLVVTIVLIFCYDVILGISAARYYFPIWTLIAVIIAMSFDRAEAPRLFRAAMVLFTLAAMVYAIRSDLRDSRNMAHSSVEELTTYLADNSFDIAYITRGRSCDFTFASSPISIFLDGGIRTGYTNPFQGFAPVRFAVDSHLYKEDDALLKDKKIAVLMHAEAEDKFVSGAPWDHIELLNRAEKSLNQYNKYNVYRFDESPVVEFVMPRKKNEERLYTFAKPYVSKSDRQTIRINYEENVVEADSPSILTSQTLKAAKGTYSLVINYKYSVEREPATFIAKRKWSGELIRYELPFGQNRLIINNFKVKQKIGDLELVVENDQNSSIQLQTMIVKKTK